MTTKLFTWNGATGSATATATGSSNPLSTPNPYKTVVASMGASAGFATVLVDGSIDGGTSWVPAIATLSPTGATAAPYSASGDCYDTLRLRVTAITGAGAAVTGRVRYTLA